MKPARLRRGAREGAPSDAGCARGMSHSGVCRTALLAVLLLLVGLPLHAPEAARTRAGWVSGRIVSVHDGDTATLVTQEGRRITLRFYGVDAPELATHQWPEQAHARDAGAYMRKLILEHEVSVRLTGEKTYGRLVGEVFIEGHSASRELVREGLGWWNQRYAQRDSDLQRLQESARASRKGLWRSSAPEAPWDFRDRHRKP